VLAREHDIPFYVAAPLSTVDLTTPDDVQGTHLANPAMQAAYQNMVADANPEFYIEHLKRLRKNGIQPMFAMAHVHTLEAIDVDDREAPRNLFLAGGEDVHHEAGRGSERIVSRRGLLDADEDERRIEAHGAERAHRHPLIGATSILRGHDRDARRKPAEHTAEFVWSYAQVLKAGEIKRLKRKRGFSTRLVGMKSPATPTSRSAISLRRERAFAALLRK